MALREQKADNTGGYSIYTESVFLTSAAASKSAPAVVDEELTHSLYWENIKKNTQISTNTFTTEYFLQ